MLFMRGLQVFITVGRGFMACRLNDDYPARTHELLLRVLGRTLGVVPVGFGGPFNEALWDIRPLRALLGSSVAILGTHFRGTTLPRSL